MSVFTASRAAWPDVRSWRGAPSDTTTSALPSERGRMLRFAVIGTSGIAGQFVEAAAAQGAWLLSGVLGSSPARGGEYLSSIGASADVAVYDGVPDLLRDAPDVVYIASPNGLHFDAACRALAHGTHVIVEKPAFTTAGEWARAHEIAEQSGVLLLEAARHIYEDNYLALRAAVHELGAVTGASLAFRQFSSRWPAYLAGGRPRVFSAAHAGGALVDLGVYQLYAALDWFGVPDEAHYAARLLPTGADAAGVAILRYDRFDVTLAISKVHASGQHDEIYGEDAHVLAFNNVADVEWARQESPTTRLAVPLRPLAKNKLTYEVEHFTRRLLAYPHEPAGSPYTYARLREWGHQVAQLTERLRHSAGIVFPADAAKE